MGQKPSPYSLTLVVPEDIEFIDMQPLAVSQGGQKGDQTTFDLRDP